MLGRDLLAALENSIRTRGVEVVPAFQDFDKLRRGIVPVTQFRRIMDRLALPLSDIEAGLVTRAFAAPSRDRAEVQYQVRGCDSAVLTSRNGRMTCPGMRGHDVRV